MALSSGLSDEFDFSEFMEGLMAEADRKPEEEKLFLSGKYYEGIQRLRSMYLDKISDTTKTKEEIDAEINSLIMSKHVLPKYREIIDDRKMHEKVADNDDNVSYRDPSFLDKQKHYVVDSIIKSTYLKVSAQALLGATEKDFKDVEDKVEKDTAKLDKNNFAGGKSNLLNVLYGHY